MRYNEIMEMGAAMESKLSAFERRMRILSVFINGKFVSRLELSRWFGVSDVTINCCRNRLCRLDGDNSVSV